MLCGWAPACSEARKKTLTDTLVVRPLVHIYIWSLKKWSHWINHVASLVVNYSPDSPLPSLLVGRWDKYLVDTCHWNDCSLTCSQTIHMARLTWGTFFFWLHWKTCKILVPWLGIELVPSAMKAWRPNHWTTREFSFLRHFFIYFWLGEGFVAACGFSLVAVHGLLTAVASLVVAHGLERTGLVVLRHVGSSQTRDWICVPYTARQILNQWTNRAAPWTCSMKKISRAPSDRVLELTENSPGLCFELISSWWFTTQVKVSLFL